MVVALTVGAALAGCGGGDDGGGGGSDTGGPGAQRFKDNCSSCHTLAAAGASGKVGPNLDQLQPSPDLVARQVTNGGGAMPAFGGKLTEQQIQQIADYVSQNAGQS
ncbi:MAG TPA: cytochrome c [Solirubrobacter sp.]|nr:cytochrome c [Solirubrobacter sp.]